VQGLTAESADGGGGEAAAAHRGRPPRGVAAERRGSSAAGRRGSRSGECERRGKQSPAIWPDEAASIAPAIRPPTKTPAESREQRSLDSGRVMCVCCVTHANERSSAVLRLISMVAFPALYLVRSRFLRVSVAAVSRGAASASCASSGRGGIEARAPAADWTLPSSASQLTMLER
jgi:hypothetical protein